MEGKMNIDYKDTAKTPKERAQALLSQMTLKEKVGQLNQRLYGFQCYEVEGDHIILSEEFKEEVDRWQGLGVLYDCIVLILGQQGIIRMGYMEKRR